MELPMLQREQCRSLSRAQIVLTVKRPWEKEHNPWLTLPSCIGISPKDVLNNLVLGAVKGSIVSYTFLRITRRNWLRGPFLIPTTMLRVLFIFVLLALNRPLFRYAATT